jgi:ribosomal RNA-processing protein 36
MKMRTSTWFVLVDIEIPTVVLTVVQSDDPENVQEEFSQISFGALAKAQASLGKRKRSDSNAKATSDTAASALEDIRARIREAREQKRNESGSSNSKDQAKPKRSSKHAPMVQSSKRAVTRKRLVVEPPNAPKARDPRFDPTVISHSGAKRNAAAINQAYSFLDEYRAAEIKQLKEQMTRTKDPAQKEELKRALTSASDRMRSLENKKREQDVLAEHRKRERQLLREGKKSKPYFLKKSELKREVLVKKYESMGGKERAKALERRRKKIAGKEKKDLPWGRRTMEETGTGGDGGGVKRRKDAQ